MYDVSAAKVGSQNCNPSFFPPLEILHTVIVVVEADLDSGLEVVFDVRFLLAALRPWSVEVRFCDRGSHGVSELLLFEQKGG